MIDICLQTNDPAEIVLQSERKASNIAQKQSGANAVLKTANPAQTKIIRPKQQLFW